MPTRALVRVSTALRQGAMSNRMTLAVPQLGRNFEGMIEEMDEDYWGNVTYLGLVRDVDGRNYRFVVTAGPRNTFAHIGTSKGTFELVATAGDLGWLMPTRDMDRHVDYSQPDYILPEEPRPYPNDG